MKDINSHNKKNSLGSLMLLLHIVGAILLAGIIGMLLIRDVGIDTDVTSKTTNVGLVLTGTKDDANYCQVHYDSLKNIKDELNLSIICKENIKEDKSSYDAMKELIEKDGCKVIVATSFGYEEYVVKLAAMYHDICFLHPVGRDSMSNLESCMGRMYQARYLAGIVAGMRTDTKEIGYVASFPISEVICQINAFTLGLRSVAPDANVHVIYDNSWVDDDLARTASEELLDAHPDIDILTMHMNSLMPDRTAAKRRIWSIGINKDNADLFPDSYLTACVWSWDDYYRDTILSFLQGKFHGRHEWVGMENGIVGLSDLTSNCAPGTKEAVEAAEKRFKDRSFDVFYGPVTDNKGNIRIPEGESMSDEEMLNHFEWYVEGVTVEE